MVLKNKELALIAPHFFGYEKYIAEQFEREGYTVRYYDERKNDSKLTKIAIRLFPKLIQNQINRYYRQILDELKANQIERLVVIKSETMPLWFINEYKQWFPDSIMIHYMQDSIKNYPHIAQKAKLFDYAMTFDRDDSVNFQWIFRPFFFHDGFRPSAQDPQTYELSFVGTIHGDRPSVMRKILANFPSGIEAKSFIYYFVPMKLMFLYGKYIRKDYQEIKLSDVSTVSLDGEEVSRIIKESKCIIDIQHANQSGLTARTIETLGAKRKLITTNRDITNYDFYEPRNILVIDRQNPVIDLSWLDTPYEAIDPAIYEYYSLAGYVHTMIECFEGLHKTTKAEPDSE